MAAHDPARRRAAAAAGGRARIALADPNEIAASRRAGAAAIHTPAALARRIAKRWPAMSTEERAEVRTILGPLLR